MHFNHVLSNLSVISVFTETGIYSETSLSVHSSQISIFLVMWTLAYFWRMNSIVLCWGHVPGGFSNFFENLTVYSGFNGFQWLYNEKTKNLGTHFLQSFLCSRLTGLCFSCLFFSETIKKYIFNMILMVKIPYGSKK